MIAKTDVSYGKFRLQIWLADPLPWHDWCMRRNSIYLAHYLGI